MNAFQEPPTVTGASLSSWPLECLCFKEAYSPLHILLCKLPHSALADMLGPVCPLCSWSLVFPRAALCGHGGDTIAPGPTHTSSAAHTRAATSLQVSALPGVSLGQDHSLPSYAAIPCSAREPTCRSTLQLMFY